MQTTTEDFRGGSMRKNWHPWLLFAITIVIMFIDFPLPSRIPECNVPINKWLQIGARLIVPFLAFVAGALWMSWTIESGRERKE